MKGKKITKIILPFFIIFIMVMSGIGYMAGRNSEEVIKYNGFKFSKVDNGWLTYSNDLPVILINKPSELEGIDAGFVSLNELNSAEKIYLSSNPKDNLGRYLQGLQFNVLKRLKPRIVQACYTDNEECKDFVLKDCNDASSSVKVILIKKGKNLIEYKDNCLIIQGEDEELVKYIDKFIMNMFIEGK